MKKLLCLALIGVVALTGCSSTKNEGDTTKNDKEEVKEETKKTEFAVGETAEVDGIKITVNSVREDEGSMVGKPEEGNVFFVLDVTLENTTDKEFNSSSMLQYEVKDADGRKQKLTIFATLNGSVDTKISANDKTSGEIAFEVPAEGPLELTYKPGFGDSVKIVIR